MLDEMMGPMPQGLLEQQQYPWYIENLVRPLARIGKNLAVGTAGIGDLAELPVNVGRGLLGYEPYPSVSGRVNDYINEKTGGMTAPRDSTESALDFITPFFAPTGIGGAAGKAVNTGGKMYNADLKMPTLVEQARQNPSMYINNDDIIGVNQLKNKYPSMYLNNNEYDNVYNLAKDPANRDKVLHELNVARLKAEKNYPEWQARLYQTLDEYGDDLRDYGHGLLAKAPEFGQDILKSVTYPGRKAMKEEQVLHDQDIKNRLKNALPLDIQRYKKTPGEPYNFQIPIVGDIGKNTLRDVKKIIKSAGPEDSVELLIDSYGGMANIGDRVYNTLVNSPANIKTTIVGDALSAAGRIALAGKTRDGTSNSRFMDHLTSNIRDEALSGYDALKSNKIITEESYNKAIKRLIPDDLVRFYKNRNLEPETQEEAQGLYKLVEDYGNFKNNIHLKRELTPYGSSQLITKNRQEDLLKGNDIFINGQVFKNMPISNRLPIPNHLIIRSFGDDLKYLNSLYKKKK